MSLKQGQSQSSRLRRKVNAVSGIVGKQTISLYVIPLDLNHKSVSEANRNNALILSFARRVAIGIEVLGHGRWAESL